jgi:tetratricopeptide (TPR) repeat protein
MQLSAQRLDWIGRESAMVELQLGRLLSNRGDLQGALRAYDRSLALESAAPAWVAKADVFEQAGRLDAADAALARAFELAPDRPDLAYRGATLALRRGERERARGLLERAISLEPDRKLYRVALERMAGRGVDVPEAETAAE